MSGFPLGIPTGRHFRGNRSRLGRIQRSDVSPAAAFGGIHRSGAATFRRRRASSSAIAYDESGTAAIVCAPDARRVGRRDVPALATPVGPWLQRPGLDLSELADSLVRQQPGHVVLAVAHAARSAARDEAQATARILRSLRYIATGTIELPPSLPEYLASRSENLNANLRRRTHKIEREHGPVTLEVHDADGGVAAGIGHYADLESAGWKAKGGTGARPRQSAVALLQRNHGILLPRREGTDLRAALR